jgi:hypothetical protein
MFSPGYKEENKTKPALTLKIEESDGGLTPEKAAEGLYEGAVPPIIFDHWADSRHIYRHKKGRFPHHRYVHRGFVPNEHPGRLSIRIKRPQRLAFRCYRHSTFSYALVNRQRSDVIWVDWPHAMAERCG